MRGRGRRRAAGRRVCAAGVDYGLGRAGVDRPAVARRGTRLDSARLAALDIRPTGDIEQPHVRPWSTVMRVPTSAGDLWFKANVPALAYEAGVVGVLARTRPDLVPELAAVDLERGWMLMGDGGERLRELVVRENDLGRWLDVLPLYGELQLSTASQADELVALGAPDRRLTVLQAQYEQLIEDLEDLSAGERDRLRARVPEVAEMCRHLSTVAIPETVQHDDLHDAQVFVREGRYLFFDWGDSCVSHPFFSMSVTLEGQLAWGLDDIEGSVDITPFRDAYLRPFASSPGAKNSRRRTPRRYGSGGSAAH